MKHTRHIMKKQSSTIERFAVGMYSQKEETRKVTRFKCSCNAEEVFYRQVNSPDFTMEEYYKKVEIV